MKHPNSRELYDYWATRRGSDRAPARAAINPAEIGRLLGDTFMLESDGPSHYPYRLAGTRLCDQFGRELKGRNFLSYWGHTDIVAVERLMSTVTHEAAAVLLGVDMVSHRGQTTAAEMIFLPVSTSGAACNRILGLVSHFENPSWLGKWPIIRQSVTSLRLIWPDDRAALSDKGALAPIRVPAGEGRRRGHLVVLDGGRALAAP